MQRKRSSLEGLPRIKAVIVYVNFIFPDNCGDYDSQFYFSQVSSFTGTWADTEWDERILLSFRSILPALGLELIGIGPPDIL